MKNIIRKLIETNKLFLIKYNFEFLIKIHPGYFLDTDNNGKIFDPLFLSKRKLKFNVFKYVIDFYGENFPIIFSSPLLINNFMMNYLKVINLRSIKYFLKFLTKSCPCVFLLKILKYLLAFFFKNRHNFSVLGALTPSIKYFFKFIDCNFPEISNSTNNFILPLMMEIQN